MDKQDWIDEYQELLQGAKGIIYFQSEQNQNVIGSSWFFDTVGDETIEGACDITDHYVENNTAYQDNIALKPVLITLQGYIGELVEYRGADERNPPSEAIVDRLYDVASFALPVSPMAKQIQQGLQVVSNVINTANNIIDKVQNFNSNTTKQQIAYNALDALRRSRKLVDVQMAYGKFTNYAIQSVKMIQSNRSKDLSDIVIVLKEMRITTQKDVLSLKQNNTPTSFEQSAPVQQTISGEVDAGSWSVPTV